MGLNRKVTVVVCLFIAAGVAYQFLDRAPEVVVQPEKQPTFQQSAALESVRSTIPKPKIMTDNAPLPILSSDFANIYDELKIRADGGNAKAACYLGLSLSKCHQIRMMEENGFDTNQKSLGNAKLDELMAKTVSEYLAARKICAGLSSSQLEGKTKYLRQAAHANIPSAMITYSQGFSFDQGLASIQNPEFHLWRKDAPKITERALRQGTPEAAIFLRNAYAHDANAFAALLEDNPVNAQTYSLLVHDLYGGAENYSRDPLLSEKEFRRAESDSRRMFAKYFKSRVVNAQGENSLLALAMNPFSTKFDESVCKPNN
jgi:hypothetical protein